MADGNRKATWADIMHPPDETRPEIIGGDLYHKAMPRRRHGVTMPASVRH